MRKILLTTVVLAVAITSCKRVDTPVAAPQPASTAPATAAATKPTDPKADASAADDNLNAVLWVQDSIEYRAVCQTIYRAAADHLDAALKQKDWDALTIDERGNKTTGLPPAVVMDVDETVLDNSPYQARLVTGGKEYDEVTWDQWVAEKKAKPVPGVVEFAKAAQSRGVTIIYLSNRAVHLKDATIANLKAVGMPVKDDSVFLGLGTVVDGCEQSGSEKNCRRKLAGQQYRVLMQFGDQIGDFVEVLSNTREGRAQLLEQHGAWFGERWWMLPNPTYGSWEPVSFNNDWSQPREARRQAKRQAIQTMR